MLKFTISELLWLTVVVALGVGWFLSFSDVWSELYGVRLELESVKGELESLKSGKETQIPLVNVAPGRYEGKFSVKPRIIISPPLSGQHGVLPDPSAPAPNLPRD